ncbi:MAG: Gfo/Idh/MocA family oxidoreductase [Caldimonas sp.]
MAPTLQRVLVVGTGSIGRRHIGNLRALVPGARYAFLRADGRRDELSAELGAAVVTDIAAALAWAPTLAVIANPSDRHAEVLLPLLQAGVSAYIEKPVVVRELDAAALDRLACSDSTATQVGCVLRFLPSLRVLKSWLEAGRLGRVVRTSLEVGQWLPDWRPTQDYRKSYSASRSRGGGVVFDLVHELDLACWLFGDVRLLGAWGDRRSTLEIETEDVATMVLQGGTGEHITVQLDYVSRVLVRRIHIVGDAASATWDLPGRLLALQDATGERILVTEGFDTAAAYVEAMRDLIEAARSGAPAFLPLKEGLRATRLAIEANSRIRGEALQ